MWSGVEPVAARGRAAHDRARTSAATPPAPGRPASTRTRCIELVADALGLLDAYGLGRVHVLGHDWGAAVGWNLAGRHPDRVAHADRGERAAPGRTRRRAARTTRTSSGAPATSRCSGGRTPRTCCWPTDARRLRGDVRPGARVRRFVRPLTEPGALTGPLNWYRAMSRRRPRRARPGRRCRPRTSGAPTDLARRPGRGRGLRERTSPPTTGSSSCPA